MKAAINIILFVVMGLVILGVIGFGVRMVINAVKEMKGKKPS